MIISIKNEEDAAKLYADGLNAIPTKMVSMIWEYGIDLKEEPDLIEITAPLIGDLVSVDGKKKNVGYVFDISEKNGKFKYTIETSDGNVITANEEDITVVGDTDVGACLNTLYPFMWQFNSQDDIDWLEFAGGIELMSRCGFKIFWSKEYGYFFGVEDKEADFTKKYWLPLYKCRGLDFHMDDN